MLTRWRSLMIREYNELGCALFGLVLLVWFLGIVLITKAIDAFVICMQFGLDAYAHHGLRPVPHRGFFQLNNGQTIAARFQILFVFLFFILMPIWMFATVLCAVILRRLSAKIKTPHSSS